MKGNAPIMGMMIKKYRLQQNMSQETLCKGICAVSYLSKIEKGTVICSEEILDRLFKVLSLPVPQSAEALMAYKQKLNDYFHHYFYMNSSEKETIIQQLKPVSDILHHSSLVFDITLVEIYEEFIDKGELQPLKAKCLELLRYVEYMEDLQAYRLYLLLGMIEASLSDKSSEGLNYYQLALNRRRDGVALASLSSAHYTCGNYMACITLGNEGYALLMEEGNALRAISLCFIIAAAYANYRDIDKMLEYYNRILALNKLTGDSNERRHVYYNIGATYLINREYHQALDYLERALALYRQQSCSPEDYLLLLQKLFLTHIALSQRNQAEKYLSEAKAIYNEASPKEIAQSLSSSLRWMEILYHNKGYLHDEDYLQVLKRIFEASLKDSHHGFNMFYGQYLIEAYKAQRKYKEALKITEALYVESKFS